MSQYYLVPITSQQLTIGEQTTVNAPAFLADLNGATFTSIPYGSEPICILTLASVNPALAAEDGVYEFASDLTTQLADADVSTLSAFLANANIPSDQIESGMTFGAALNYIASVFLVAQALAGASGAAIFTDGVTLDTQVGDSDIAPIAGNSLSLSKGAGNEQHQAGSSGGGQIISAYDFSGVSASDSIGDMLDSVSSQVGSINLGEF
jgi:hypothetical protein